MATATKNAFAIVTPGDVLKEEFLDEYGLSQNALARAIGISPNRITEIVNDRRRITADAKPPGRSRQTINQPAIKIAQHRTQLAL